MSETIIDGPIGVGIYAGPQRPGAPFRTLVQLTIRSGADHWGITPTQCRELIGALQDAYRRAVPTRERLRQMGHTIPAMQRHLPEHCDLCLANGWTEVPYQ